MSFGHFFFSVVLLTFVKNSQQAIADKEFDLFQKSSNLTKNSLKLVVPPDPSDLANPGFVKFAKFSGVDENGNAFDKFYWYPIAYKAQWVHAKLICKSNGLGFVTLDSQDEANNFWSVFVQKANLFEEYTMLGALTVVPRSKNDWYWVEGGKKVKINMNWAGGQPDNWGNNEACLLVQKTAGGYVLHDGPCSGGSYLRFLCQSYVWH